MVTLAYRIIINIVLVLLIGEYLGIIKVSDLQVIHITIESDAEQNSGFESVEESEDFVNEYDKTLLVVQAKKPLLFLEDSDYKNPYLISVFIPPEHRS